MQSRPWHRTRRRLLWPRQLRQPHHRSLRIRRTRHRNRLRHPHQLINQRKQMHRLRSRIMQIILSRLIVIQHHPRQNDQLNDHALMPQPHQQTQTRRMQKSTDRRRHRRRRKPNRRHARKQRIIINLSQISRLSQPQRLQNRLRMLRTDHQRHRLVTRHVLTSTLRQVKRTLSRWLQMSAPRLSPNHHTQARITN